MKAAIAQLSENGEEGTDGLPVAFCDVMISWIVRSHVAESEDEG